MCFSMLNMNGKGPLRKECDKELKCHPLTPASPPQPSLLQTLESNVCKILTYSGNSFAYTLDWISYALRIKPKLLTMAHKISNSLSVSSWTTLIPSRLPTQFLRKFYEPYQNLTTLTTSSAITLFRPAIISCLDNDNGLKVGLPSILAR